MSEEIWLDVVGYEGKYHVSSLGRIRSLPRKVGYTNLAGGRSMRTLPSRIKAQRSDKDRYRRVNLSHSGRKKTLCVHQLVAEAFIGPRRAGFEVAHADGDPTNNRLENLRYATPAENAADRERHGTIPRGEQHKRSKLKEYQVREIRTCGLSCRRAAEAFGVCQNTIAKIRSGETWRAA